MHQSQTDTATSPVATFQRGRERCPFCGNLITGRPFARTDSTLMTCQRKRGRGLTRRGCGGRVAIVPIDRGLSRVVGLTRAVFDALAADGRPIEAVLAEHGYDLGRGA